MSLSTLRVRHTYLPDILKYEKQIRRLASTLDKEDQDGREFWLSFAEEIKANEDFVRKTTKVCRYNRDESGGRIMLDSWKNGFNATVLNCANIFIRIQSRASLEVLIQIVQETPFNIIPQDDVLRLLTLPAPEVWEVITGTPSVHQHLDNNNSQTPANLNKADCAFVETAVLPEFGAPALVADKLFWPPNTKLKVFFMLPTHEDLNNKVMEYAALWTPHSTVTFERTHNQEESDIRVTYYLGVGCFSSIGRLTKNIPKAKPTMCLAGLLLHQHNEEEVRRNVLHEFGHALGLLHEHQHPDIRIPWDLKKALSYYNQRFGWDQDKIIENILQPKSSGWKLKTDFDVFSIMRYPIPRDVLDSSHPDLETWLQNNPVDRFPSELSEMDKMVFKDFYNKQKPAN